MQSLHSLTSSAFDNTMTKMTRTVPLILSFAMTCSFLRLVYLGTIFDERSRVLENNNNSSEDDYQNTSVSSSSVFHGEVNITNLQSLPKSGRDQKQKSASSQSQTQNDKRPLFILHVGPRKTGTSTIQNVAAVNKDLLKKDNIVYVGHHRKKAELNLHDVSELCLSKRRQQPGCKQKWKELEQIIIAHYNNKENVLLSDETVNRFLLDPDDEEFLFENLKNILKNNWNVRIVFSYRRYHTWIPSSYFQAFDPSGGNHNKTKREAWPDAGGREIPSFPEYFDRFWQQDDKQPLIVYQKWKTQFPNSVQVFNMHQDSDNFVSSFFCTMVPEAVEFCNRLKSKATPKTQIKNSSTKKALHYDMLAARAYNHSMVPPSLSRVDVSHQIEEYAHKIGWKYLTDFPMKCLNKTQTATLYKISQTLESELVPDFYQRENSLKTSLEEYFDKGSFCSIDAEATLRDDRWKQFFANLQ